MEKNEEIDSQCRKTRANSKLKSSEDIQTPVRAVRPRLSKRQKLNCTPLQNRTIDRSHITGTGHTLTPLLIPPSPSMKKLGYGTGVNVYLIERFSPMKGCYKSPWAIKKMNKNADLEFCERLKKEAKILKSLCHPNIIGFRSYTKNAEGSQCLVMESGENSLTSFIEKASANNKGPLPVKHILKVIKSVSSALHYLHMEKHLLHGDLKSANILVKGNFETIKLCDFGVTVQLQANLTADPMKEYYIGTECWSAPEAVIGDTISNKTDIFSLGLIIWEMIALAAPHIDKLGDDSDTLESTLDEIAQEELEKEREIEFQTVLGTRPALPNWSLDDCYNPVLEMFFLCTEEKPSKRPSAKQLLDLFF